MSKKKIEKPKVFISYAWGSTDYQDKVLSFATQLMGDGIEVVLDKWDLTEGNDTYAFMEKCATDETITNVLMLIDPIYAKKADAHSGGVGTETQIISAKVYQEVTQDKFIPIVFERDEKNEVCKPTYLQGRLHFDLTQEDKYDSEYLRLVKTLYGEEVYQKPELGSRPAWVDHKSVIEVKKKNAYDTLKSIQPEKARKETLRRFIKECTDRIKAIVDEREPVSLEHSEVFAIYDSFKMIRSDFLHVLEASIYVENAEKVIAKNLEEIAIWAKQSNSFAVSIARNFIHELFLYSIAFFMKSEEYESVGYLLGRAYYNPGYYRSDKTMSGFDIFYSGSEELLDRAMKARDNKNYFSGAAAYWIENIDIEFFTKEQFVLADLLCFNYSIYGKDCLLDYPWFPMSYVYDNKYGSVLGLFSKRLVSREYIDSILPIFGYANRDDFVKRMNEVEMERKKGMYKGFRYNEAWDAAAMLGDFIKTETIASIR